MDEVITAIRPLLEPAGIGALFALAITLGFRLLALAVEAWRQVTLQRVENERVIADAVRELSAAQQSSALAWRDLSQELREQGIVLPVIAQREGLAVNGGSGADKGARGV